LTEALPSVVQISLLRKVNLSLGVRMGSPSDRTGLNLPLFWHGSETDSTKEVSSADGAMRIPDDEEVMARLCAGDSGALNLLLDRYSRLVLAIANRILHDRGEAEDVVQDVFLQVYKKANQFNPGRGTAKAWIVQIAFHKTYDRRSHLIRMGFYNEVEVDATCDWLRDRTDLDRELGSKLNRVQIDKALNELSDRQRRTLELYFFEGLTLTDITHKLAESKENIRHHLYRGMERLRESVFVRRLKDRDRLL
jgi:RNA polymerase sigma-70 factor (ECF subfamily)